MPSDTCLELRVVKKKLPELKDDRRLLCLYIPGGRYCARSPRTPLGRRLAYGYAPGVGKMLLRKRGRLHDFASVRPSHTTRLCALTPHEATRLITHAHPHRHPHTDYIAKPKCVDGEGRGPARPTLRSRCAQPACCSRCHRREDGVLLRSCTASDVDFTLDHALLGRAEEERSFRKTECKGNGGRTPCGDCVP